jgi:hypothetical protein
MSTGKASVERFLLNRSLPKQMESEHIENLYLLAYNGVKSAASQPMFIGIFLLHFQV